MKHKMRRVALYLRVSTGNQTVENQRESLQQVTKRNGWQVVEVFQDAGVSGSKGRDKRPGLDALMNAVARGEVDMVAAWSMDRLGRSLPDLIAILTELQASGIDLYLEKQAVDTSTPAGKMLYHMLGAFAEFERELIRERVQAGLERARKQGKILGRPQSITPDIQAAIERLRAEGKGMRSIAKEVGCGLGTVHRVLRVS